MTDESTELTKEERLRMLDITLERNFQEAIDDNADIVGATKKMAHNLIIIMNAHLAEVERIKQMINMLAESAVLTADMIGDMVSAEFGIEQIVSYLSEDDEEYEEEEDE